MTKISGVKGTVPQVSRRKRVIEMLKAQLKSGVKTKKGTLNEKIPLTEKDVKRINKEIEILKTRV
jgi:Sec7-like guanine-nucleotide exchange factor